VQGDQFPPFLKKSTTTTNLQPTMSQQVPAQERNHLLSKKRPLESSDSEESSRKRPALLDLLEVGVVVHVEVEEEKKEEQHDEVCRHINFQEEAKEEEVDEEEEDNASDVEAEEEDNDQLDDVEKEDAEGFEINEKDSWLLNAFRKSHPSEDILHVRRVLGLRQALIDFKEHEVVDYQNPSLYKSENEDIIALLAHEYSFLSDVAKEYFSELSEEVKDNKYVSIMESHIRLMNYYLSMTVNSAFYKIQYGMRLPLRIQSAATFSPKEGKIFPKSFCFAY